MYEQGWRVMVRLRNKLITLKLLFDLKIFPRAICILFSCAFCALIFTDTIFYFLSLHISCSNISISCLQLEFFEAPLSPEPGGRRGTAGAAAFKCGWTHRIFRLLAFREGLL